MYTMKKYISIFALALVVALPLQAQKLSHFSQYHLMPHTFNPAFTGIEDYLDLKAGFRFNTVPNTVNDFRTPANYFVGANFSIRSGERVSPGFKAIRNTRPSAAENFSTMEYHDDAVLRHGIGLTLSRRDIGPFSNTSALVSYALHMPISRKWTATMGISTGLTQDVLRPNEYQVVDTNDPIFVGLNTNGGNVLAADLNIGAALHHEDMYVAYALNQILRGEVSSTAIESDSVAVNYMTHTAQAGYRFQLTPGYQLMLSGALNMRPDLGSTYVGSAKIMMHEAFTFGLGYRSDGALTGYLGLLYDYRFTLGYSYDLNLGDARQAYTTGAHELVIGIALNNRYFKTPYFW